MRYILISLAACAVVLAFGIWKGYGYNITCALKALPGVVKDIAAHLFVSVKGDRGGVQ